MAITILEAIVLKWINLLIVLIAEKIIIQCLFNSIIVLWEAQVNSMYGVETKMGN